MKDLISYPTLRYRRFGGGYRRAEVLYHLRELETTVRRLEGELAAARGRSDELSLQLASVQAEVASLRAREGQAARALADANRRAGDIVGAAEARAQAVLAEADEQAARIRGDAHLKIDDIGRQLQEILRLRDSMIASLRGVVQDVGLAVGRVERGEPVFGAAAAARAATPPSHPEVPAETPVLPGDEVLLGRRVELDAGPFPDFATLSGFERAVGSVPNVDDVYVRRFSGERATIEVAMAIEQPLLALLRAALPYDFDAERDENGVVRLSIAAPSLAGTG